MTAVFAAAAFISHCQLRDASFEDCSFIESGAVEECHFSYTDLHDASFNACHLSLAYFSRTNCFCIALRECDLKDANFHGPVFTIKSTIRCTSARHLSQAATSPMPI